MAIIGYINVEMSGGGDRTMGAGLGLFAVILGVPILILLVDGFSYLKFHLTNTIIIYWILYLLNIFIDSIPVPNPQKNYNIFIVIKNKLI